MKKLALGLFVLVFILGAISGCATMIHTNQANVVAASGTSAPIKVIDNGMPIYEGSLPASFPVKSGHSYTGLVQ
jgi:uncharacterized protein YceK